MVPEYQDSHSSPLLLNVKEAGRELRMSPRAVYSAVARGELPVVRISRRRIRFSQVALMEFIQAHQVGPTQAPDLSGRRSRP